MVTVLIQSFPNLPDLHFKIYQDSEYKLCTKREDTTRPKLPRFEQLRAKPLFLSVDFFFIPICTCLVCQSPRKSLARGALYENSAMWGRAASTAPEKADKSTNSQESKTGGSSGGRNTTLHSGTILPTSLPHPESCEQYRRTRVIHCDCRLCPRRRLKQSGEDRNGITQLSRARGLPEHLVRGDPTGEVFSPRAAGVRLSWNSRWTV